MGAGRRAARAWNELGELLSRCARLLGERRRQDLLEGWQEICALEESLDDRLVVGLVGGTGVGKSTLINALAGDVVSTAGDRRPTTSRIVVYRHRLTKLPEGLSGEDLSQPQVEHDNENLGRIVLLRLSGFRFG